VANGLGGGLLVASLAELVGPEWHHIITFATPFATVGSSAAYFIFYRWFEKWTFERSLRRALEAVDNEISNPSTSPDQKEKLKREREALVQAEVKFHRDRTLQVIGAWRPQLFR
jgi:hypothetical protein